MSESKGLALPPNLASLLAERDSLLAQMGEMASGMMDPKASYLFDMFSAASRKKNSNRYAVAANEFFDLDGARKQLDARMWKRAVDLSRAMEYMPLAARRQWQSDIQECNTPEFTEEHVIPTLKDYITRRYDLIANTVDGIFRALSNEHLTNAPEGFGRRMILSGIQDHSLNGNAGHIHDLRRVIAMLSERELPEENNSYVVLSRIPKDGKWHDLDGRAIQVRRYLKGTAHLQVHPDMAWRLNKILAVLHPSAIPAKFRTCSKANTSAKSKKTPALVLRPIPHEVLQALASTSKVRNTAYFSSYSHKRIEPITKNPNAIELERYYQDKSKFIMSEAKSILERIGGTQLKNHPNVFEFDYPAESVINEIVLSGVVPDEKAHQFCPTGPEIASIAASYLDVEAGMTILEPSAGTGNLVDALRDYVADMSSVQCVEVSSLHCKVLESKGLVATKADFMEWAPASRSQQRKFDRVIMNPPFCNRQWRDHLVEAASLVSPGGRIVAILPTSAENEIPRTKELTGWNVTFHRQQEAEFGFASVSTTIAVIDHPATVSKTTKMAA